MYARCMSIDRWYWRLVRGRCATTTRTQSPESLSSIQCLGALSLLRCFLGPRVYEKEAEAITYTTASGERDTTQIVGIGSQSRHHVEYGSRSSIARSRCGTIVRYLTDERWTTMRGFDVSRGKEERLDATKEQKSITDTRATPSSPRSLTGPLVLLRVPGLVMPLKSSQLLSSAAPPPPRSRQPHIAHRVASLDGLELDGLGALIDWCIRAARTT